MSSAEATPDSGQFDPAWYDAAYREAVGAGSDGSAHYLSIGEAQGLKPNAVFDPLIWSISRGRPGPTGALADYVGQGCPTVALDPAVAFAGIARPQLFKPDRPKPKERDRYAAETRAAAGTLGEAAVSVLPTAYGERLIQTPAADELLGRVENDQPFSFARLPHGFWDCLYMFEGLRARLGREAWAATLSGEHLDRLTSRLCDAWFPDRGVYVENFLPEIMADITAPSPATLLNSVAFKPFPTADNRPFWGTGAPSEGSLAGVNAFARTVPAETPVYDAHVWKRWVFSGDILKLPALARRRPIVFVGAERVGDLGRRWDLPWFEQVEIPWDGSYPFRQAILDRCVAAVEAAKVTAARHGTQKPMVLLQGGSFAYWLIVRLARHDPDLFYLDFGQALHAWFLDVDDVGNSKWAAPFAEPIMRNGFARFYADQGIALPEVYEGYASA